MLLEKLKQVMMSLPILAILDFNLPFIIVIGAFRTRLGALLSQNHSPIAYFSHTLSARVRAKSIYDLELMVEVLAIKK